VFAAGQNKVSRQVITKSLIQAVIVAAALAAPVAVVVQSNQPVTRAQVSAGLVEVEQTGWRPAAGADLHYPEDIQAAQARVAAQNGATGVGVVVNGSSDAGRPGRVEGRLERDVQPSLMHGSRRARRMPNASSHWAPPSECLAPLRAHLQNRLTVAVMPGSG